jgi:hypothetical protein
MSACTPQELKAVEMYGAAQKAAGFDAYALVSNDDRLLEDDNSLNLGVYKAPTGEGKV